MENASKALLMAGGILIGILILSLMTTLFVSSRQLSANYDNTKNEEAIQRFNVNFTKYLGQDITIHQHITIKNFADIKNNKIFDVTVNDPSSTIEQDIQKVNNEYKKEKYREMKVKIEIVYKIDNIDYDINTGYVSAVNIGGRKLKITEYDEKRQCIFIELQIVQ